VPGAGIACASVRDISGTSDGWLTAVRAGGAGSCHMTRTLHILVVTLVAVLSVGEAYHFHPEGGARWHFAAVTFVPASPATDGGSTDGNPNACPLHFWASVFSTVTILLALLLIPPAPAIRLHQSTPLSPPSWRWLAPAVRGPPLIFA
jgi:hypothetical protein